MSEEDVLTTYMICQLTIAGWKYNKWMERWVHPNAAPYVNGGLVYENWPLLEAFESLNIE